MEALCRRKGNGSEFERLLRHAGSPQRTQVDRTLTGKRYGPQKAEGSLDFVVMFVPGDAVPRRPDALRHSSSDASAQVLAIADSGIAHLGCGPSADGWERHDVIAERRAFGRVGIDAPVMGTIALPGVGRQLEQVVDRLARSVHPRVVPQVEGGSCPTGHRRRGACSETSSIEKAVNDVKNTESSTSEPSRLVRSLPPDDQSLMPWYRRR